MFHLFSSRKRRLEEDKQRFMQFIEGIYHRYQNALPPEVKQALIDAGVALQLGKDSDAVAARLYDRLPKDLDRMIPSSSEEVDEFLHYLLQKKRKNWLFFRGVYD